MNVLEVNSFLGRKENDSVHYHCGPLEIIPTMYVLRTLNADGENYYIYFFACCHTKTCNNTLTANDIPQIRLHVRRLLHITTATPAAVVCSSYTTHTVFCVITSEFYPFSVYVHQVISFLP